MAYETELEDELEQELEGEWEGELEGEMEAEEELEGEAEFEEEGEWETEGEEEYEISPIRKIYPDAMMEHLGALAAESETEEEATEHFLPLIGMAASKLLPLAVKAIGPLAKKAMPRVVRAVTKVSPRLTRGVGKIARMLHRNPGARRLLRTVPTIVRRTVHGIARQAARGRPITQRSAIRTLAQQTRRVLRNPRHRRRLIRRNYVMDQRFHRRVGRGVVRPHWSTAGPAATNVARAYGPAGGPAMTDGGRGRSMAARGCVCSCQSCGAPVAASPVSAAPPGPAYCGCCGQPR